MRYGNSPTFGENLKDVFEGKSTREFACTEDNGKFKIFYIFPPNPKQPEVPNSKRGFVFCERHVDSNALPSSEVINIKKGSYFPLCIKEPKYKFRKDVKALSLGNIKTSNVPFEFKECIIKSKPINKQGRVFYKVKFNDGNVEEVPVEVIVPTKEFWEKESFKFGISDSDSSSKSETESSSESEKESKRKATRRNKSHHHHHHHKKGRKHLKQPNVIIIPIFMPTFGFPGGYY